MSETDHSGYGESPDTTDGPTEANMVDGVPGQDRSDGGERDVTLTTDEDAQRDDSVVRGGNQAG
ncbi:hypothetical protein SAMN04488107_0915 [Geodermatophilus saharensis]|uniref:Uncharacterized protein n=1 Tax=Geodermatophilus saharensis TaxID=1137994 RepID=A0A239B3S8_9ACTN|nr:hypothetical protein [Geodermatophilus saharensis]SNS02646.1 hypothetical protein SAMN04488107_0915 [Geodermatophilus saharensis]